MKAKSHLIILLPLYFLLFLTIFWLINKSYIYEDKYYLNLQKMPILVYSQSITKINSLNDNLSSEPSVSNIEIRTNDTLKSNLIEKYKLQNDDLMKKSTLPHLMIISLKSKEKDSYFSLIQRIRTDYSDFLLDYNAQGIEELFNSLENFKLMRKTFLLIISALSFLIVIFAQLFFEKSNMDYWNIYTRAGGDRAKRSKSFLKKFSILYIFGVILSFLTILFLHDKMALKGNLLLYITKKPIYMAALTLPFVINIFSFMMTKRMK
ncbi:MAG: hypothetical protein LHW49_03700 [Candidatus Cloacimonetes bacterium]|nr:hypothetical protein [Candidatus Cloacimonadota bacterium]MDD2650082.1 hypothetical protein [Candidatus Cloacimonadota bacterium]MDD3501086.1 hypothetical protein [Candidatus Cloacimonadota bacterium]